MTPREIKPTRRMRRTLTVLLTGASNIGGATICHLTGVTGYPELVRLHLADWVFTTREANPGDRAARTFYHLTPDGRLAALDLLGLRDGVMRP